MKNVERSLADDFIRAAHLAPKDKPNLGGYQYVGHLIQRAHRFHLSTEIRYTVHNILETKPSNLLEATKFARLPFPITWFEWTPPDTDILRKGQYTAMRVGALMRQEGERSFRLFTCWKLRDREIDFSNISNKYREFSKAIDRLGISAFEGAWDFDYIDGKQSINAISLNESKEFPRSWFRRPIISESFEAMQKNKDLYPIIKYALKDPKEHDAMMKIEKAACYRVHTEIGGEFLIANAMNNGEIDAVIRDLEDEIGPIMGMLIMLNSKNCIEIDKTEIPTKFNAAQRKQGKPELVSYSTVNLKLSRSQDRVANAQGLSGTAKKRHLVRGHFKVRKTGVFYWSHHMAGRGEGYTIRKGYEVEK